jgi:hypothetical protein
MIYAALADTFSTASVSEQRAYHFLKQGLGSI